MNFSLNVVSFCYVVGFCLLMYSELIFTLSKLVYLTFIDVAKFGLNFIFPSLFI